MADVPRPIKRSAGFAASYLEAEDALLRVIAHKWCFDWPPHTDVNDADNALLGTEAAQLMAPLHPEWRDVYEPVPGLILPCWTHERARAEFMMRFEEVTR